MKKKSFFKMNSVVLLASAAVLLLASTVGSTQAALTYYSDNYSAEVTVSNIGVTLVENGNEISKRNYLKDEKWDETTGELLKGMLEEGEAVVPGRAYDEVLSIKNSGAIDSYVRVVLKKSWQDAQGNKNTALSPDLIRLNLLTDENGWVIDESASTPERTVLYYTRVLPVEGSTPAFTDQLRIDPAICTKVIETVAAKDADGQEYKTITYVYEYDGYTFQIEAEADAVQTHNAQAAIKSAWGVAVSVAEDGSLSLE